MNNIASSIYEHPPLSITPVVCLSRVRPCLELLPDECAAARHPLLLLLLPHGTFALHLALLSGGEDIFPLPPFYRAEKIYLYVVARMMQAS